MQTYGMQLPWQLLRYGRIAFTGNIASRLPSPNSAQANIELET